MISNGGEMVRNGGEWVRHGWEREGIENDGGGIELLGEE